MEENDFYCTQLSRQNNYKLHKIQEINNLKDCYTKFKGREWCQWGKNNLYRKTDSPKDTQQLYNKCNFKSFAFSSVCCRLTRNLSRQKKVTYMSSYAARALTAAASSAAVAAAEAATSTQKTLGQAYGKSHGPPATAYDENLFNNTFVLETSALSSSSANLYSYSASNSISSAFAISYGNLNESTATGSSTSSASLSVPSSPTSTTAANASSPSAPFIDVAGVNVSLTSADDWSHFYDLVLSWQGICLIAVFCAFIVITIIGNTLVILAVITTRRLKTVTNCFVMSLAVADLLVGIFVMPPAVAVHLIGSWQLGWVLCDIWISLDVLLCTASILSLCAISVDRYLAVTQPLTYSRKRRSKRLALIMILIVWVLALAITCPPILGWYEPGRRDLNECRYNQNEGYVIFSAMGSFFIPMAVMIYVYARISCVIANRHDNMTDIHVHNKKLKRYTGSDIDNELDPDLSEFDLGSGQKKQLAVRTLSNQTLAKDLQEIIAVGDNKFGNTAQCHSLLALEHEVETSPTSKNGCYEMKRPASLKRVSTASSVITTMTSTTGTGTATAAVENPWSFTLAHEHHQQQQQQQAHYQQDAHPNKQMRMHTVRQQHYLTAASTPDIAPSPGNTLKPEGAAFATGSSILRPTTPQLRSHHHQHTHSYTTKSLSNRISTLKKETKTTQTLSIVVGGFIACWLPFFINYLITPFLHEDQVSSTLAKMLTWLGWFNSAINPFIYAFYSVDFRAAFWRLTCKRFFSSPSKPQFPANTMSIRR